MRALFLRKFIGRCFGLICIATGAAYADRLETIDVIQVGQEMVITVQFRSAVQYIRRARLPDGASVQIELQFSDGEALSGIEKSSMPAVPPLGRFSVSLNDIGNQRALMTLEWKETAPLQVLPGNNGRSLRLILTPGAVDTAGTAQPDLAALETPPVAPVLNAAPVPNVDTPPVDVTQAPAPATTVAPAAVTPTIPVALPVPTPEISAVTPAPAVSKPNITDNADLAPPQTPGQIEERAKQLLQQARQALDIRKLYVAIDHLSDLLKLPPNSQTETAQELIGDVRAEAGNARLARVEYDLFLKLYPQSQHVDAVRKKLAALGNVSNSNTTSAKNAKRSEHFLYGGISQQVIQGATKIETTNDNNGVIDKATFNADDQSLLVSNLDFTYRYRSNDYDVRAVLRDTDIRDQTDSTRNRNRLNSAYLDVRALQGGWSARLGRQTQNSAGVFGRFDGATLAYNWNSAWQQSVVAGKLVEYGLEDTRQFFALAADDSKLTEHSGASFWLTQQTAAGILDRQAFGVQWRFQQANGFASTLLDYDTLFKQLNIVSAQGNWQTDTGKSYNAMIDYRRSPGITTSNATLGEPSASLTALRLVYSEQEIRQMALDKTATSNQLYLGATQSLPNNWQLGEDIRVFSISDIPGASATPTVPGSGIPPTAGTGNIISYGAQLTAFNYPHNLASSFVQVSRLTGDQFSGFSASLHYSARVSSSWRVEAMLRWSSQTDNNGRDVTRLAPVLRLNWQFAESMSLESEYMQERSDTQTATTQDKSVYDYLSIGYRWDF